MARAEGAWLDTGVRFPDIGFQTVHHGHVSILRDDPAGYKVVLIYRGHW